MTDKKLEAKRLAIFLLLAFGISWLPAILFNKVFGYHEWFETNKMPVLFWIVGFGSALANVITRKLTHEGWSDSLLHLNLKGNLKYYVFSVAAIGVIALAEGAWVTIAFGGGDFTDVGKNLSSGEAIPTLLLVLATAPLMAFNTFGEEFGWRGYMNQKMEPLLGTTGTIVVGGVLWGLWHAELTVEGHNFGTDYPGYPYLGILSMCIGCTFMGVFLMWLTKRTNSIYPAAIFHAMNNFGGYYPQSFLLSGVAEDFTPTIGQQLLAELPLYIAAFVVFIWLIKGEKKRKAG
ncbi:MAG: CPBP family intramembrane metalloprotease [Bacteroides sp.]|nr:CPBP family intramembrane metalloprotease [Eubacterium sp.]MCM1417842.1 CPBP family intramembrane metalloprotease [Roseburia sp.]MCM1461281.1 CPBP family intramembrane metalloprotease [Bacteroides sp.]